MNHDELNELRAYKMGYDLGWYRATEILVPLLNELQDCMSRSATWKQIEEEGGDKPVFINRVFEIIADLNLLKSEHMPALVLEQKAINDMGKRLSKLTKEDWETLSAVDNSSLDLNKKTKVIGRKE